MTNVSRETDSWNKAIEAAALVARTSGAPKWSWSESSLIINDTCDLVSDLILKLRKQDDDTR
jgi:hypothetical protein